MAGTRKYKLGKRGETAEETRRRIVEATFALHDEQGIAATSMKQIAARAGVSIGSVYHHFPTYGEAVRACGAYTMATHPLPDPESFESTASLTARIRRLVSSLQGFYEKLPVLESAYFDRRKIPALDEAIADLDRHIEKLAHAALQDARMGEDALRAILALLHFAFYQKLRDAGLDQAGAERETTGLIMARLEQEERHLEG